MPPVRGARHLTPVPEAPRRIWWRKRGNAACETPELVTRRRPPVVRDVLRGLPSTRTGEIVEPMSTRWKYTLAGLGMLSSAVLAGCSGGQSGPDSTAAKSTASTASAGRPVLRVPDESEIKDPHILASVRRGRALLRDTGDSIPDHVGNAMKCVSCHPNDGTLANASPWVGVYARFPQYRPRAGAVLTIEDRINGCFRRSMNGTPLDPASRDMRDMVAYFSFLSRGYAVGSGLEGRGLPKLEPLTPDTTRGRALYTGICFACHGTDGQGTGDSVPPLWGPKSFNIGAGMARLYTAASFIRFNMPQNNRGILTNQQAFDVAAFVLSHSRPDFPGKEKDWPNGDPPPDVAYPTTAAQRKTAGSTSPDGRD